MGLLNKLTSALRGGSREALQAVVDSNALRILEQEIHDWERAIQKAKHSLAQVIAERLQLQREIDRLSAKLQQHEQHTLQALREQQDDRATQLAANLALDEQLLADLKSNRQQVQSRELQLRERVYQAVQQARHSRRELRLARANEHAIRASAQVAGQRQHGLGKAQEVNASLARIKQRQQETEDQLTASAQIERSFAEDGQNSFPEETQRQAAAEAILQRLRAKIAD